MTIVKHELKMNFKSLIIWTTTIGSMIFAFMLMFPMLEDSLNQMGDMYSSMGGFSAAFGLDKLAMNTPMGYYGTEVGAMLSLGGALFGALLGVGIISKEEGGHTAEFLLSAPVNRAKVVLQKLLAMLINIVVFDLVCMLLALLSFALISGEIDARGFMLYHLAQFFMHLEIACICFCISAFFKKTNAGLGLGIAIILYFLDIMVKTITDIGFLKYITPFYYAGAADIISSGKIDILLLGIGIMVIILSAMVAIVKYAKKDIVA